MERVATDLEVRAMQPDEVDRVATIHRQALGGDFLPSLGQRFLQSYYASAIDNPFGDVLVALRGSDAAGFVNVTRDTDRFFSWFKRRRWPQLGRGLIVAGLRQPSRLREAWAIARTRAPRFDDAGEIAFIAVAPEAQRSGIGRILVDAANRYFLDAGLSEAYTKTLAGNEHVISLYQRHFDGHVASTFRILHATYVCIRWRTTSADQH